MYKCILIATDGSDIASKAVAHGVALAKVHNAKVAVVTVTDIWSSFAMAHDFDRGKKDPIGHYEALAAEAAQRILDKAGALAKEQGVDCKLIHVLRDQWQSVRTPLARLAMLRELSLTGE